MSTHTEHWFGYTEPVKGNHIAFTVTNGVVEVDRDLWAEILDTLGFKPELTAEELDATLPK